MVDLLLPALFVEGALTIALAVFLLVRGLRNRAAVLAAFIIGLFGLLVILRAVSAVGGTGQAHERALALVYKIAFGLDQGAQLLFVALYPSFRAVGWRGWVAGFAAFPLLVAVTDVALRVAGNPVWAEVGGRVAGVVEALAITLPVTILGYSFLKAQTQALKTQHLYVLLPFIVWALNHAALGLHGSAPPQNDVPPHSSILVAAALVAIAVVAAICVAAFVAARGNRILRRSAFLVSGWTALMVPLATLQFVNGPLHLLVDGLMVVALFYGIARFQILDVDLRVRGTTRNAVRTAFALPVFFITQQAIEGAAGQAFGVAAGVVIAGLGLYLLQLAQTRLLTPEAAPKPSQPAYEVFRRLELYRTALEGILADGTIDPAESRTLELLREKLGVAESDHAALLRDVRVSAG